MNKTKYMIQEEDTLFKQEVREGYVFIGKTFRAYGRQLKQNNMSTQDDHQEKKC